MSGLAKDISALESCAAENQSDMLMLARKLRHDQEESALCWQASALSSNKAQLKNDLHKFLGQPVAQWHFAIADDKTHKPAYDVALRRSAKPNSRVLEIKTSTGLPSTRTARPGAAKGVSGEMEPAIAQQARKIVAGKGLANNLHAVANNSDALDVDIDVGDKAGILVKFDVYA